MTAASRQREWAKRMQEQGRCILCGEPAARQVRDKRKLSPYCQEHRDKEAKRMRELRKRQREGKKS